MAVNALVVAEVCEQCLVILRDTPLTILALAIATTFVGAIVLVRLPLTPTAGAISANLLYADIPPSFRPCACPPRTFPRRNNVRDHSERWHSHRTPAFTVLEGQFQTTTRRTGNGG